MCNSTLFFDPVNEHPCFEHLEFPAWYQPPGPCPCEGVCVRCPGAGSVCCEARYWLYGVPGTYVEEIVYPSAVTEGPVWL